MSNVLKCPTSPLSGTSTQQKLKSKQAAYNYKHGSPKIRDLLREKCRIRVKEARTASFEDHRNIESTSKDKLLIKKILREELADIEEDIKLQELIYNELIDEITEWYIDEFEKDQDYLIEVADSSIIFCPICQKSNLTQLQGTLSCECGIRFSYKESIEHFQNRVKDILKEHELKCNEMIKFFIEPNPTEVGSYILNTICEECFEISCIS